MNVAVYYKNDIVYQYDKVQLVDDRDNYITIINSKSDVFNHKKEDVVCINIITTPHADGYVEFGIGYKMREDDRK